MRPLALLACAALVACASTPHPAPPDHVDAAKRFEAPAAGHGRVYLFRGERPIVQCTATLAGREVVLGAEPAFAVWEIEAGVYPVELVCSSWRGGLQLIVEDGGIHFLDATAAPKPGLRIAGPERGRAAIEAREVMGVAR